MNILNMIELGEFHSDFINMAAIFALAILWAAEHFFIQASLFDSPPITRHPRFYQVGRLAINFWVAIFILSVATFPWQLLLIGLDFFLSLVVIAYQRYFQKPLAPFIAIKNIREGIKVSSFAIQIIPPTVWLCMVLMLAVKVLLAIAVSDQSFFDGGNPRLWCAIISLALISAMILLLQKTSFRFSSIRYASMTRIIYAYGYSISWIADFFLSPSAKEVSREAAALQKKSPNRLSSDTIPYQIDDHVVILQLESLDWNILNFSLDGKPVTPFLNEIAANSLLFKVESYHDQGSADMDYAVLSGGIPSKRMLSYSIPDLTYPDSLPRYMSERGYKTTSLHGATGNFFNRRSCFDRMGWDEICFREEFNDLGVDHSYWGIRDKEVFRFSSQKLQQASQPEFHFLITLDSHGPFNLIKDDEKKLFPNSRDWQQNYFNSMAALDRNLRAYLNSLPPETLVVMYGDHTSGVNYEDFSPARAGNAEYVPCIIYQITQNPQAPNYSAPVELPADLSILDIINCIRKKIKK